MTSEPRLRAAAPLFALILIAASAVLWPTADGLCATRQDSSNAKPYALIFGTVWGADNRPVYGVPVKIRRADEKKARWELTSDHSGEFAQRLPVGKADYIVWLDIKVPKGKEKPQKLVHVESDERQDISLHLTE